jgi:hypothetical protein
LAQVNEPAPLTINRLAEKGRANPALTQTRDHTEVKWSVPSLPYSQTVVVIFHLFGLDNQVRVEHDVWYFIVVRPDLWAALNMLGPIRVSEY